MIGDLKFLGGRRTHSAKIKLAVMIYCGCWKIGVNIRLNMWDGTQTPKHGKGFVMETLNFILMLDMEFLKERYLNRSYLIELKD